MSGTGSAGMPIGKCSLSGLQAESIGEPTVKYSLKRRRRKRGQVKV